ncbi:MAG TPA: hypothetical protein VFW24_12115 [Acidimicrobiales bacterium]|nr:hypothetical protein [Acidimicrobiales bacterium]
MTDGPDDLEATVSRWAADEEAREVARIRSAARRLTEEAAEESDLPGVLRHLRADGCPVRVTTGPGRTHRGVVRAVGDDYLALATERAWGLVALRAVAALRVDGAGPDGTRAAGAIGPDWSDVPPARLIDAVERLAGEDLPVRVHTTGDTVGTVGELSSVGVDHLQLACDPDPPLRAAGTLYVPLGSLAELWLLFRSG